MTARSAKVALVAPPRLRDAVESLLARVAGAEVSTAAGIGDADALMLPAYAYDDEIADALRRQRSRVRWLQILTAGYDRVKKAGVPSGIIVTNAGDSLAPAVAEHALGLLLALGRQLPAALHRQAEGNWDSSVSTGMSSLRGKTVVIVGFGAIGREVARLLRALSASVIGVARQAGSDPLADRIVPFGEIDDVLAAAHAIVLSVPLDDRTRGMFDAARLARCRSGACIVNISRGPLIDSHALVHALEDGRLGGAALDVTDPEPLPAGHPLWSAPNVIITPHVAAAGGHEQLARFAAENLRRFVAGEPLAGVIRV